MGKNSAAFKQKERAGPDMRFQLEQKSRMRLHEWLATAKEDGYSVELHEGDDFTCPSVAIFKPTWRGRNCLYVTFNKKHREITASVMCDATLYNGLWTLGMDATAKCLVEQDEFVIPEPYFADFVRLYNRFAAVQRIIEEKTANANEGGWRL